MAKVVPLQRQSLTKMIDALQRRGPNARGVITIILDPDGHACFHISGFPERGDLWTVAGLCEWVKADVMVDIVGISTEKATD